MTTAGSMRDLLQSVWEKQKMTKWDMHKKKIEKRHRMEQALLEESKQCFGVVLLIISWLIFGVVAH